MPGLISSSSNNNSTGSSTSTSSTGSTGTSTSTPTFSGDLGTLMGQLENYSTTSINNPSGQLAPVQNAGLDQINQEYSTIPQAVSTQLASRGYGSSGAVGNSLYQVAEQKAGAQAGLSGQLAQDAVQQGQFGAGLADQLLAVGKGTSNNTSLTGGTTTSGTTNSSSNTTNTPSILSSIEGLAQLLFG